ncbi:MAG TPA: hypothetical protein VLW85_14545 [Myxococcales bacterium]|nr:hypothetical protein [Myxococcales bacterium]
MNGPLAQVVALTCHANAALRGLRRPSFERNSTAGFCSRIDFEPAGEPPDKWIDWLVHRRAGRVLLSYASADPRDRVLAGLAGGGGLWTLHAMDRAWAARWTVEDVKRADRRIWSVTYATVQAKLAASPPLQDAKARVEEALVAISSFAGAHASDWQRSFEDALRALRGAASDAHRQDLAPEGALPPEARTLLQACQYAWVFGTMGSWNDIGYQDAGVQAEYDRVSQALFDALNAAIPSAANASAA